MSFNCLHGLQCHHHSTWTCCLLRVESRANCFRWWQNKTKPGTWCSLKLIKRQKVDSFTFWMRLLFWSKCVLPISAIFDWCWWANCELTHNEATFHLQTKAKTNSLSRLLQINEDHDPTRCRLVWWVAFGRALHLWTHSKLTGMPMSHH